MKLKQRSKDLEPKEYAFRRTTEKEFETALRKSLGLQSKAADMLGISQAAVCLRIKNSPHLQQFVEDIRNEFLDLC